MYVIDITHRAGRSLRSAKMRTLLTAFAIAVGAFALTLTLAASNGAQNYADTIINDNFDPSELIVTNDDTLFNRTDASKPQVYDPNFGSVTTATGAARQVRMLSEDDLAKLRQLSGVESVRPSISLNLQYVTRDGQKKYIGTVQAYNSYRQTELLAGTIPKTLPKKSLILPEAFLSSLGFKNAQEAIGKQVRFGLKKQTDQAAVLRQLQAGIRPVSPTKEEKFTVIAVTKKPSMIVQPGTELYMYVSSSDVAALHDYSNKGTDSYRKYLTAFVRIKDGTDLTKLTAAQNNIKAQGYSAQSVQDTQKVLTQIIGVLQGIVTVFGFIAIVASIFGVVNTMYISVLQRTREIGLMKALGMHKKDVSRLFRLEAASIGLLGGVLGSVLAIGLGTLLNPFIASSLGLGGQNLLEFRPDQIGLLIFVLIAVATLAGLLPARKAAKLDPIEALRTE